jgi:hypothetical protein
MKALRVDALTQQQQITVVLSVVKRMQLHRHRMLAGGDDPRELEEGQQSSPGRMSRGGRKTLVANPHDTLGQGQFEDGQDLIRAMISLIHRSRLSRKIFQCAQEITLLTSRAFPLGMFFVTRV